MDIFMFMIKVEKRIRKITHKTKPEKPRGVQYLVLPFLLYFGREIDSFLKDVHSIEIKLLVTILSLIIGYFSATFYRERVELGFSKLEVPNFFNFYDDEMDEFIHEGKKQFLLQLKVISIVSILLFLSFVLIFVNIFMFVIPTVLLSMLWFLFFGSSKPFSRIKFYAQYNKRVL